jgi:carbamoyltransferase
MSKYILGINLAAHDTSACLLRDGNLVGFIEEERLTRVKHTGGVPRRAIDQLLKGESISIDQISHIAISTDVKEKFGDMLEYWRNFRILDFPRIFASFVRDKRKFKKLLRNLKKEYAYKGSIEVVDHHIAHLASAYLVSPYKKSAILSIDGGGDGLVGRTALGEKNKIKLIDRTLRPHSVGILYEQITKFLGFNNYGDEGKVMGLSSYGEPGVYKKVFNDIIKFNKNGSCKLNTKYFKIKKNGLTRGTFSPSGTLYKALGSMRKRKDPITQRHENIAASLQQITEKSIFHILNALHKKTKCENLCLSGGVILNSVANGKLHKETPFKNIFIQPIAYDSGNAIGAAFYLWNSVLKQEREYLWKSCYLGPSFSTEEVEKYLKNLRLNYERLDSPTKKGAELISQGNIIGWFQGNMEAGARALGNRSILADPRRKEMKDIINARVKHREAFRPFAPSILIEKINDYFKDDHPVPYMERVFTIRAEKRKEIPAVTHVDGTGRLQTVAESDNKLYYNLIKEFEKITNIPVVLNTSFNVNGEPIVCTPEDAIRCFFSTGLDCLVIDKFLIRK